VNLNSVTLSASPSIFSVSLRTCSLPDSKGFSNTTVASFPSSLGGTETTLLPSKLNCPAFNLSKAEPVNLTVLYLIALTVYQHSIFSQKYCCCINALYNRF
jgi:hypothetical protein